MPYPAWTYALRALWLVVQASLWKLAWKRIVVLRPLLLRIFGCRVPLRCSIAGGVQIYFPWALRLGAHVAIAERVSFYNLGGTRLGDRVVVSQDVYFCGGTHDYTLPSYPLLTRRIVVEDDVWICAGAFIGPGVTIGRGAVVGARAVVIEDVPPWKVVAGNPARVIKDRVMKSD
jgi:putative colanic acid biosynthesis acetyltransferase WcaF